MKYSNDVDTRKIAPINSVIALRTESILKDIDRTAARCNDALDELDRLRAENAVLREALDRAEKKVMRLYARGADTTAALNDERSFLRAWLPIAENFERELVDEIARHIENHSCVSSCCEAQPSGGESKALAECVRRHVARISTGKDPRP